MRVPQDSNSPSSKRRRNYNGRSVSGNSRAVQTMTPQSSPSCLNGNTSMDSPQQSGTSPGELMAEMQSMLATLRLRKVSDAKDDFHEKFIHIKSEVENMKENLASRIDVSDNRQKIVQLESDMEEVKKVVMEIGQKVGHVENDVGDMKRELADFSSMKAALASLQEQLQMLLNGYITPGAFQTYPSYQPPPGV